MMMQVSLIERRTDFAAPDSVLVGLGCGMEPRMKMVLGFSKFQDAYGWWKLPVDGMAEIVRGYGIGEREGGYLANGMDACVGAAGTGNIDRRAFQFAQDRFENALDGGKAWLNLPAVKVRAIIGDSRAKTARWAFHETVSAGEADCGPGKPYYTIENSGNNCPQFVRLDSQ
jgi:hypothetical protein